MKITFLLTLSSLIFFSSCAQNDTDQIEKEIKNANHLIDQSSPYLLQHAYNPVDWYPWGEDALKKAKDENKLILISIGYAACHWCHVMEHESFEDSSVAAYMNEHFIAIKVDREERPDIDQVYMNAVQLLSGSGGWPLNCIALPDGRPIYGGTYFPKKQWLNLLEQVGDFVKKNPEKAEQQAVALTAGVQKSELIQFQEEHSKHTAGDLVKIWDNWKPKMDFNQGGIDRSPKFPLPVSYEYLLQYHFLSKDESALNITELTLRKMADGGIYDQIGGGFARYSTDAKWKVPHFEKMLYDNAQLVGLYARAFQHSKNPYYKQIVEESLGFIQREMTSDEGGFYSSLDADSEGEEGKFYVWKAEELDAVLGEESTVVKEFYNVSESGNWESNNILYRTRSKEDVANKYGLGLDQLNEKLAKAKKALLKERAKRIRPGLDDKILCAWNALMLKGYVDAYRSLQGDEYLKIAEKSAAFILENFKRTDGGLNRNYKNGQSTINGFLDDYAFTIEAFIGLYQATLAEKWLIEADLLMAYALAHFGDENSMMFFYTSDEDNALIARKMEVTDNVIPSSNSAMAKNLYILGKLLYKDEYIDRSVQMLNNVKEQTPTGMSYYANWDILLSWLVSEPYEVVVVGKDYLAMRKEFDQHYLPNVFFAGGRTEGKLAIAENKMVKGTTTIYVCQNKVCELPTESVHDALKQLNK
ncbi:MAG: thioredoxin domain-containing protein [Chitinophagales bacterium]|nr:thioredoxin domain-containing protein [Chitinophagales bacterium]